MDNRKFNKLFKAAYSLTELHDLHFDNLSAEQVHRILLMLNALEQVVLRLRQAEAAGPRAVRYECLRVEEQEEKSEA